ncbi:MAG: methyl-accepting chemotaxis protein [Lachnospiraceae bacterium]|nr:methyl-accepting chemotaxis protein [Lachnospiraceae bacterium]
MKKQKKGKSEPEEKKLSLKAKGKKKRKFALDISIKIQLFASFLLPILCVVIVGVVSYKKAESGMIANYEAAAMNTIEKQVEYIDFGLMLIRSDAVQVKVDTDLQNMLGGTYDADATKVKRIFGSTLSELDIKIMLNNFIENIYIVPSSNLEVINPGSNYSKDGFFEVWKGTEEGTSVIKGEVMRWMGSHPEMDALLGTDDTNYILSYMSIFSNKRAVLVVDISTQALLESLQGIDVSDGGIIGFITADGREVVYKEDSNTTDITFADQEFYQNCIAAEENTGTQYVEYNGEEYLFLYCKSEETKATLVYMVPEKKVTATAGEIWRVTVLLVIIACVLATLVAGGIFFNINANMNSIIKRLKLVAGGDLTVEMKTEGRSEFTILNRHIAEVIINTRKLLQQMEGIIALVNQATDDVEAVSREMEISSAGIIEALGDIDQGVNQQADDSQDCLLQMDGLSQTIEAISKEMNDTAGNSSHTKDVVNRSISTMDGLTRQTQDTISVTGRVKEDIGLLAQKSKEIRGFVDIISEITNQTNLLSLNASIEAARAGEAGRGFAVVAEEIHKLADGSRQAADEINKVVETIEKQTRDTVKTALKAESIVREQADTVEETKKTFQEIYQSTEEIMEDIRRVSDSVENMNGQRGRTLEAISSISAVSEETAASSANVYNIARGQEEIVGSLDRASKELKEKMEELQKAVSLFKTN